MRIIRIITVLTVILAMVLCCACGNNGAKADITDTTSVNDSYIIETEEFLEISCPWDDEGAKQPSEYTWEEFEALDGPLQIQFQDSFDSINDFDKWMQEAKYVDENGVDPWDVPGAKQPSEYTWEEFNALTGPQQMQFQYSFDSFEEFDAWLTANQPK